MSAYHNGPVDDVVLALQADVRVRYCCVDITIGVLLYVTQVTRVSARGHYQRNIRCQFISHNDPGP